MKAGSFVVLRNAKIDMFRGSMRLAVNRWGKIEAAPEGTAFEVKTDHNLSLVEYELVQVGASGWCFHAGGPSISVRFQISSGLEIVEQHVC